MRILEIYNDLLESKATEAQGLNILKSKNIQDSELVIKKFAELDKSQNQKNIPLMAFFYGGDVDIENISKIVNDYNELLVRGKIKAAQITKDSVIIGDKVFKDFIKFSEYIDGIKALQVKKKDVGMFDISNFISKNKTLWSGNGIDIYDGNSVGKCIAYTQGGLTGKHYSFCIGQPGNTMYKSYRDSSSSTFYFIVDRNHFATNDDGSVNLDDPLHMVVFDNSASGIQLTDANNTTGTIDKYGEDVEAYVSYLESKGVPVDKLVNRPKSDTENYEDKLLGKKNNSLDWFINLDNPKNPDYVKPTLGPGETDQNYYKSAYIGRGHVLSPNQFDWLLSGGV